jgi:hypothetical protein
MVMSLSACPREITAIYVAVAGRDRNQATGFPFDCVFVLDDVPFTRPGFIQERSEALTTIWATAKLIE